ncbi:MAG: PAS domain S-box protein, partial [Chloroflexi bacterium]|nr:PAS domain S-box protein [Chloroflexota bacterium]
GWDEGFGTAQTRIIDDLRTIPPTPVYQQLIKDGLVAGIQARLVVQGQLLGLFGLNAVTPGFFTAEDQEIATEVANQLAIAVQQMHLSEAITRHTAELERHVVEIQRTDEVLRRSESLFRAIFEQVAVGIARCALDGRCLQVNQRFSEIVGYSIEELLEKTFQSFTHPADLLADLKGIHQLEQGEIPFYATQKRYCHQRGHVVWVNLTVSLVRDAHGAPDYYIAVVEEITQLKQAEQALLQSEERHRRVVEDQLDLIGRFQLDFKLTFVNRAYAEAFGKDPDALIGQSILDLIPPAYHAYVIATLASMNPAKLSATSENPLQLADGTLHWFQWTNQLTLDEVGHPFEYQAVGRDITAQKTLQAEQQRQAQAVEEMRQFLESTLDAFPASTAVLASNGAIIKINAAWQQFGKENGVPTSQRWLGENYLTVCDNATGLNAAEAELTAAGIRAVIRGQKDDFYLEYPCHSATEQRWSSLRVTPFAEAPPRRVVVAHSNITDRMQIAAAERGQRRFAEALRDSLAALTSSLAVERVMQQILDSAAMVVPSEAGSIILFEGDQGRVAYVRGFTAEAEAFFRDYRFSTTSIGGGPVIIGRKAYFVPNTQADPTWMALPVSEWIRSSIGTPIEIRGLAIGLLVVDSATPDHFQTTDIEKLQVFAHHASLALENAQHVTQLEQKVAARTVELNEAKERVEAILNNSPDGILIVQSDLSIQQTNAAFHRLFACEPDDAYYGSLYDLIHAADLARVQASITTALQTQTGQQIEIRCYRKDGTLFEVNFRISQIPAPITGAARLLCTLTDITERKQAQTGLAEERNLLRTLIDTIPDYIYIKDRHHRTVLSNLARANSFGMTPEETVGKDDFAFVPAAMAQQFQADEAQLFQSGLPLRNREERTIGLDGSVIWAATTKFPLRNLQGELIGLVGITRDISERKARERQLHYYASLQENVSDAVIATDLEFRIQSWNQAAETIYGWRAEEAIGQKVTKLLPSTDYRADQESDQQAKQALLEHGKWQGEIVHRRRDGTELYILSSVTLLKDEHGLPIGVVGVNRDITDRHNAEQAMQAKTEEERAFQNYLKALHEITLELMQIDQLDEFYKQTVVLGRSRLGFDRLALFLYDAQQNSALGTFGTDLDGEIHDERSLRFTPKPDEIMWRAFRAAERFCVDSAKPLYHNLAPIGFGWNAAAALWSGTQSVGWLVTDNLLQQQPEIFALYALTIGSLLGRKKTEAAQRESEARYRLLADNITDMVIRFNAVGEFVYVSPSSRTLLGYEPEVLLGQSGFAFLHPDDLAALQEAHREILARPTPFVSLTCRFRHRAGHYLWLEFAARLIRAEGTGELLELIVSARNVTNRKKAEDALRAKTEEEYAFQTYLKALHEITIELTLIDVLDDFYKRAIELGLERFGFERLGLLLYDAEHDLILGTYGTDAQGQVVAEHHLRFAAASLTGILQRTLAKTDHFVFDEHAQLFSNFKPIGVGWNAAAGLWNGQQSLGCLAADNGVLHKPVSKALLDILVLYSSTISSLLARKQSDAALRESEERFRLLLDAAPIATVISNQTGQIVLINNQTETLFGYHREELVGQSVEVLVPHYARSRHVQNRTAYTAAPRVRQMGNGSDLLARHKDGSEFPVEIELSYIQTATGLLIMSFILDITERKRSAAALEEQRTFLRQVIDVSPSMIFVKDYDGRFVLVNPIVAQMYNTSVEALLGKSDANFNPSAQEVANFLAADRRVIASGEPIFVEEPVTSFRGETHWLQTTKVPIISADGKSKYVLGVSTDITARKKAEEALRQNEELLRTVLENLPVGVWIIDPDGTITQGNPAGQQIWGGAPTTGLEEYNEHKRWWTNAEEQNAVD